VRGFTQDDAHIFCRPDQLEEELIAVLKLAATFLRAMGFKEYAVYLSTQPEKSVGSQENWDKATQALKNALAHPEVNLKYEIDPGEGVFYGPKIDIKIKDLLGRAWQCSTIQVDFNIPERFQISYIDEKGNKASPIMIHRAIFGSLERFFGVLVEHYAGAFPLWLSPVQAVIINITDGQKDYCRELAKGLKEKNLRVELDLRQEKMQYKIRQAQLEKIPYMLVVGEKEKEKGLLSLRSRQKGDEGQMKLEEFVARVEREIEEKK
jgi:threonyl-tRNA synthetase